MPLYFSIKCWMIISYGFLEKFMTEPQITLCFPYIITKDTAILLKYIRNPLKASFLEINAERILNLYLKRLSGYTSWTNFH